MAGASPSENSEAPAGPTGRPAEKERWKEVRNQHTPHQGRSSQSALSKILEWRFLFKLKAFVLCRYRKMKERLGLTEIRKHANRMTFAEVSSSLKLFHGRCEVT